MNVLDFMWTNRSEVLQLTGEHVMLVGASTLIAVAVGVPLGILMARKPRLSKPIMTFANVIQTVPSLALFGFLIPIPFIGGIGTRTAIVALTLYSLLPIVRNTLVGIRGIDRNVRDAGVAMGMTPRQLLLDVELPLAMPSIVGGIRIATVIAIGVATIAAAIGGGGLGDLIFRGVAMVNTTLILKGAVP